MKRMVFTYLALLGLLALTVAAHTAPLGRLQMPLALAIAAAKAWLVAWFFMALRSSPGMARIAATAGLVWIVFFFLLGALDVFFRPDMPLSQWK